jgi:glycosyltransferase involved in cell wall biosynthesis
MADDIRLVTFTTLYPNSIEPGHGVFVEQRLRHLLAAGGVQSRVIAPVPWFPFFSERFGRYARFARVPSHETRHGVDVRHPRYPVVPRMGMTIAPGLLALAAAPVFKKLVRDGYVFEAIDAHYFYPDGVAAALLARRFGKPLFITARGSDINLIAQYYWPRRMIRWAAGQAAGIITVCQALKDKLVQLGVPREKITVLRNGVDLALFQPGDRATERTRLGLSGPTLLSVGHLMPHKGHDLVIQALKQMPDMHLLIAGSGQEANNLRALARSLDVADRVTFLGAVAQERLRHYYCAADALVLASSREGWANVLLEAMACGTPVIATSVGGTPEVVASPPAGVLIREPTPDALVEACRRLFSHYPDRRATRHYAEHFGWEETSMGQKMLFTTVLRPSPKPPGVVQTPGFQSAGRE